MNKKFTKLIAALALLVFMTPSLVAWGQTRTDQTITLDYNSFGLTTTYAVKTATVDGYSFTVDQGYKGSGNVIQMNSTKGQGILYNTTAIPGLKSITVNVASGSKTYTITSGTTQNPTANSQTGGSTGTYNVASGDTYFQLKVSGASYFSSIVITYETGGSSTTPTCTVNPTEWDFEGVLVGQTAQKTFTITTANLSGDLSLGVYDDDAFSVSPTTIASTATSTEVTVTFSPNIVTEWEDALVISGTDFSGNDEIEIPLYGEGLCNAPTNPLAYTTPVELTLTNDEVLYPLTPTSNGNGGTITYTLTTNPGSNGEITNGNTFYAIGTGQYVVHAEQALNGTTCGGTADITINVFGENQTITFNAGTGTSTPSMTAPQGSTIQLPTATPSTGCSQAGWTFAGWTDEAITETTTAPDILLAAGDDYTVTTNETLYAVYMQGGGSNCSVTFSESGYTNQQTITEAQIGNCATATFDKGTNSNAPKYYDTGEAIRCYGGNTITITAEETLTEIALTFGTGDGSNDITTNVGSYSNGIWTGSANSVTFTIGGTTGHRRIAGVSVTCGGTATYNSNPLCQEQVATPTFTPAAGTYTGAQNVTINCTTEDASILYKTSENGEWQTYSNAIPVSTTTTIWAKATKIGMDDSDVAEAEYFIQYTLTVDIEHVDWLLYDYTSGEWVEIEVDSENHALVPQGAEVRISVEMVDDCYVLNGFNVTYGSTTIQATDHMDDDGTYGFTMPASNATLTAVTSSKPTHTLTVEGLEHVNFSMLVGSESNPTSLNASHEVDICEQVLVEVYDLSVSNGYVLESVTLTYGDETQTITLEYGVYAFDMPSSNATLTFNTEVITAPYYALYSGDLVEGDYLIVYNGKAMKNSITNNRLDYELVTDNGTSIMTDNADIIWHIAPSGDYWTIYNAAVNSYAAATGSRNQAQLLSEGTDDKALWTATGNTTYEFENKARAAATSYPGNKWLRNNGTNGFACYSDQTGGALSLYKKVTPQNYTTMEIQPNQWYFIASPTGTSPTNVEVLSDLYYYDEQDHYWRNQKVFANSNGFINFDRGQGFLCANAGESAEPVTLTFMGGLLDGNTKTVALEYHATTTENEENTLAGWNLVGNPFNYAATLNMDCYTISGTAINTTAQTAGSYTVAPCEGVMVKATETGQAVTFTKVTAGQTPQSNQLQMTVAQQVNSRGTTTSIVNDNAIVKFNEGSQLEKFAFNIDAAKLYIPQNDKEYAIVSAEAQGEMPVNFRAAENGTYTLSIDAENVEMNYLHLIDNMTGMDIDLLQTPSYTFEATTRDYESRFRLVFAANEDGVSTGSTAFAFFSNGNWIINNAGEATLQVIDITGRIISSESVNGSVSTTLNATPGVYMLRLINGENVKVQKIVVR